MEKQSRHLVIGLGEVGKAIKTVLSRKYAVFGIDKDSPAPEGRFEVLHIAFPYSKIFSDILKSYCAQYGAKNCLVIIHSTVPVGVTKKNNAVHSPIRGIHPFLAEGVTTFTKYFGGTRAKEAAKLFADLGIKTKVILKPENTEALKLWDTTIYGWNILLQKEIYRYCVEHKLDFDVVYSDANTSYNEGYEKLGHPEFKKFILKQYKGKIGGHCIIPNAALLGGVIGDFITKRNNKL